MTLTLDTKISERAAFADGLRQLADAIDRDPCIPLPWSGGESHRPLSVYAPPHVRDAAGLEAFALSLGAEDCVQEAFTEGDTDWLQLRGRLAGMHVLLAADTNP